MNDKKKDIETKEFDVEIDGKKHKVKIKDGQQLDLDGKKDGDTITLKAEIKEDKESATSTDVDLEAKVSIGYFSDSVIVKKTKETTAREFKNEVSIYSARMHKPLLWVSIVVGVLAVAGIIWWWMSSSKNEDREEESL